MTKATKENVERLIDRLADKTLSFGCNITVFDGTGHAVYAGRERIVGNHDHVFADGEDLFTMEDGTFEILGHPIMLTDVLEKLLMVDYDRLRLVMLWEDCGVTKSLQDIMQDGQFDAPRGKTVPSAPHELFEYLLQLFPERVGTECTHPTKSPAKDAGEGETNYFICDDCKKPC